MRTRRPSRPSTSTCNRPESRGASFGPAFERLRREIAELHTALDCLAAVVGVTPSEAPRSLPSTVEGGERHEAGVP